MAYRCVERDIELYYNLYTDRFKTIENADRRFSSKVMNPRRRAQIILGLPARVDVATAETMRHEPSAAISVLTIVHTVRPVRACCVVKRYRSAVPVWQCQCQ